MGLSEDGAVVGEAPEDGGAGRRWEPQKQSGEEDSSAGIFKRLPSEGTRGQNRTRGGVNQGDFRQAIRRKPLWA